MLRIIMMQPPSFMPEWMADFDGLYSLDLNDKDKIALTRKIDDYAEVGAIKQDTFKESTIPITKKNRLLFGNIGNPVALNENNNKIFEIQLIKEDFSYPVQGLQIIGNNENDENQYDVTIFGELNDWHRPLSQLFLNELELGSEVVDATWVFDRHIDNYLYEDTSFPVFAPLCNYGEWFINHNIVSNANSQVVFNNYRFWYSILALLRQAFCQVGYELVAPILETEFFRRAWVYMLDPNFETANQGDVLNRPFEILRIPSTDIAVIFQSHFAGVLLFSPVDIVTDPGGHILSFIVTGSPITDLFGAFYSGGVVGIFNYTGTVNLKIQSGSWTALAPTYVTVSMRIMKAPRVGIIGNANMLSRATVLSEKTVVLTGVFTPGAGVNVDFSLTTPSVKIYQHEIVFVHMELIADLTDFTNTANETLFFDLSEILTGQTFGLVVEKQVIEEGDDLDFGLMLRSDITALEVFKGVAHVPNLKLETDTIGKKVYLYPEFKFNLFDDGLQDAYFKDNNDDTFEATNLIQVASLQQVFKNTQLKRNVQLKFKNSSDGYIQRQSLEQELHSKQFDFGDEYIEGNNEIVNPLFEPLDTGVDGNLGFSIDIIGFALQSVNLIPFMWESQPTDEFAYPSIGFDYAPRIAIAYELASHIETPPSVNGQDLTGFSLFVYEDSQRSFYNLFGQIFEDGVMIKPFLNPIYQANLAIVYGNSINPNIDDFFKLVYNKSINQAYFNIALSFLVMLDLASFSNISFRRKWHLKYLSAAWGEIDIYCRLSFVQDYVIGENIVTPVELVPDNNNFTHC